VLFAGWADLHICW